MLATYPPILNGQAQPLSTYERSTADNLVADTYIHAVDGFLTTHGGARAQLGQRHWLLSLLGISNSVTEPWCADWALAMAHDVVDLVSHDPTVGLWIKGTDALWENGNGLQHNWVVIFPDVRVPLFDPIQPRLHPSENSQNAMLYLDPWLDLLPKSYTDDEHEGVFGNEISYIAEGFN